MNFNELLEPQEIDCEPIAMALAMTFAKEMAKQADNKIIDFDDVLSILSTFCGMTVVSLVKSNQLDPDAERAKALAAKFLGKMAKVAVYIKDNT